MKILVPIDFSPDAEQALRYATTLSRLLQRNETYAGASPLELIILHVYHVPIGGDTTFFVTSPMVEQHEQATREKLHQLVGTIPEIQSIPHRIITKLSMPYEGIKEMIEKEEIELVVMGLRGAGDTAAWLGSTTIQMMRYGACPVLGVPRTTEVFYPQYIAFATDLETSDDTSYLEFLKNLVQLWQARVDIIHVHPNPNKVGIDQAQEALNLDHFFKGIPHKYYFIEDKLPARGIEKHLMESAANLLVVVPRHHVALERLFHKSVSKQVAQLAPLPILFIHEK
ncbi:MAG: universal stress protein [Bacteroidota bacterium]